MQLFIVSSSLMVKAKACTKDQLLQKEIDAYDVKLPSVQKWACQRRNKHIRPPSINMNDCVTNPSSTAVTRSMAESCAPLNAESARPSADSAMCSFALRRSSARVVMPESEPKPWRARSVDRHLGLFSRAPPRPERERTGAGDKVQVRQHLWLSSLAE